MSVIDETTKKPRSLEVNAAGELKVTGAGGGGGGDATAANQVTQTAVLTAIDGHVDGLEAAVDGLEASVDGLETAIAATNTKLDSLTALQPTPVDSLGNALPTDFDYLAQTFNYTGADMTSIVKIKGADTYTQTLAYSAGILQTISKWVKS